MHSRSPDQTPLHRTIRDQLEPFLSGARYRERPAPRFVEQELRAFLRCGILAHGFLRLHCDQCQLDRLVPFSCKRRGFCPSCGGRRMADTAAHLVDRVFPEVPVRQWVLTLPYPLRYRCAYDSRLTSEVLRAFFAELRRRVRRRWSFRAEQCGTVTFIQRFGSALNLNVHFHTLALDGAYPYAVGNAEAPRFFPLPLPSRDEVARVLAGTARRLHRLLETRADGDDYALGRAEPLLALLASACLRTRIASGLHAGERWRRAGDRVEPVEPRDDPDTSPRVPEHGGMSLHAEVAVPARDRRRLERLCRTVARPPLANDRLEEQPGGRLALRLKIPWRDGTTHVLLERSDLLDRLVPLIPPPRAHQVRYHGILAPCASQRSQVVPATPPGAGPVARDPGAFAQGTAAVTNGGGTPARSDDRRSHESDSVQPCAISPAGTSTRRTRWAAPLQRVFDIDALRCPRCGSTLRLLAAIEDPAIARRILECIGLPARAPPTSAAPPSDGPFEPAPSPVEDADFDQTPSYEEPWPRTAPCPLPRLRPDGHTPVRGPGRPPAFRPGNTLRPPPAPAPHLEIGPPTGPAGDSPGVCHDAASRPPRRKPRQYSLCPATTILAAALVGSRSSWLRRGGVAACPMDARASSTRWPAHSAAISAIAAKPSAVIAGLSSLYPPAGRATSGNAISAPLLLPRSAYVA